jgi:subtilase family serine protease
MHSALMDVSDPTSNNYGQHLSLDQMKHRFAPSKSTIKEVEDWLLQSIVGSSVTTSESGDLIKVVASVSSIEAGLQTSLQWFEHKTMKSSGKASARASSPLFIPSNSIRDALDYVSLNSPITQFVPKSGRELRNEKVLAATTTPTVIGGNEEVLVSISQVLCGDGLPNHDKIACSDHSNVDDIPTSFTFEFNYVNSTTAGPGQ